MGWLEAVVRHSWFWTYLVIMNLLAFALMAIDKWKSKQDRPRTSEKTLFWVAVAGGVGGALLGMRVFHHKSQKRLFRFALPILGILYATTLLWLLM